MEGVGAISLTDLVKATLRMRPDRVVLANAVARKSSTYCARSILVITVA